jgi:prepilin-type N-terminal cleavage/methylation domain-containing protein
VCHRLALCGDAVTTGLPCNAPARRRAAGFTLIELTIALFVISLLLGSLLVPLGTQVQQRQTAEAEKAIEQIKEALLGFAMANGYLPCPDARSGPGANDGVEDVTGSGNCRVADGNLPWITLNTGAADPWNNRFRYRVYGSYATRSPGTPFILTSPADLRVWTSAAHTTPLTSGSPNGAVAVIVSHGRNGSGAMNSITGLVNPAPTSADELENADGNDEHFVSRPPTAPDSPAGEFDDIVSWLSRYTLYNRMVTAGRLP